MPRKPIQGKTSPRRLNRSVATRMDKRVLHELKKIYPNSRPSDILRTLAEERIAIKTNIDLFNSARKILKGKKADRTLL